MTDRAVSTVVSYVLTLAVVAILTTTLLSAFAPSVTDQQRDTARSTLTVFGNDLAGDVATVDRLSRRPGGNATVALRTRLPDRVAGSRYEIAVENATDDGPPYDYELVLRPVDFEAMAVVRVRTRTPVATRTGDDALEGGDLVVAVTPERDRVVVRGG